MKKDKWIIKMSCMVSEEGVIQMVRFKKECLLMDLWMDMVILLKMMVIIILDFTLMINNMEKENMLRSMELFKKGSGAKENLLSE